MQPLDHMVEVFLHWDTFPFFDVAHNLLAAMEVRNELRGDFSKTHTFAVYILYILYIFSGSMTANLLLGEPLIDPLNSNKLFLATAIWYLVFFSPLNSVYNAGKSIPMRIAASVINEVYRVRKIANGIRQAAEFYPSSWIIMIVIGTIRGNGSGLVKLLIRLMQKTTTPKDPGFMQMSFTTKVSILAAFFLILEEKTSWLGSYGHVYLGIALIFVCIKVASLCGIASFQFFPFENLLCKTLFGDGAESSSPELKQPHSSQKAQQSKNSKKEE